MITITGEEELEIKRLQQQKFPGVSFATLARALVKRGLEVGLTSEHIQASTKALGRPRESHKFEFPSWMSQEERRLAMQYRLQRKIITQAEYEGWLSSQAPQQGTSTSA